MESNTVGWDARVSCVVLGEARERESRLDIYGSMVVSDLSITDSIWM